MFDTQSQKVRNQVLGLLTNRWGLGSFATLTLQQAIEASATLWLVKAMQAITTSQPFFPYLLLYLSALLVPYIPWCIAFILRISWKQEAMRSFINAFVASNRNNIGEWSNKGLREEKLSILTAEAPNAINALIDYIFDFYSYLVSVLFNIIAISIVVEPFFALAYGISVGGVIIIMNLKRKTQRLLTKKALTARVDLTQSLLAAWDNVLLGNDYNFKLWQERTAQRLHRSLRRNVDLERFDQIMAIFVSFMTALPSLTVLVYSAWTYRHDPMRLSSFVVTLPLLWMILSYTYLTLSLAFRWGMHKSKLIALFKSIQPTRDYQPTMEKKVKWDKIKLMAETSTPDEKVSLALPKELRSPEDLALHAEQAGRLTLRGENGSGKSTLLMLIKHALQQKAFFLPTHSQLSFLAETNKYSTGESLKKRLLEIIEKVDADVLLLDEWDANLDQENREMLSQVIDEISNRKCVIEVRHR
jgi:ABC-type multidrug transport system fused ATPase/permease subunit